jgi:hypothetical protein
MAACSLGRNPQRRGRLAGDRAEKQRHESKDSSRCLSVVTSIAWPDNRQSH